MALKANYEAVMVVSMKQGEDGIQAIIEKFKSLIESNATLQSVDEWGKRKLAYLINKEAEGYYVLYNFECEADFPAELDRIFRITDGVIRSLIIRKPEGAEVVIAKEEPVEEAVEEEEAPAQEEAPAEEEAPAAEEAPAEEAAEEPAQEAAE
ncbi:MAG: 30S ribosomal protein S6 [Ruminococcus sp.]|nr:30S ribosomal protein S6 [Ruminococcus sp.]